MLQNKVLKSYIEDCWNDFGLSLVEFLTILSERDRLIKKAIQDPERVLFKDLVKEIQRIECKGLTVQSLTTYAQRKARNSYNSAKVFWEMKLSKEKIDIDDLDIPRYVINRLIIAGIGSIQKLCTYSSTELILINEIGEQGFKHIQRALASKGRSLKANQRIEIDDLNLPLRLKNALIRNQITTIKDLKKHDRISLSSFRDIGSKSVDLIFKKLHSEAVQ